MSTTIKGAFEQARAEAQQLNQRLDAAVAAEQTTLRAELQKTVDQAATIAASLHESGDSVAARVREALNNINEAAAEMRTPASTEQK